MDSKKNFLISISVRKLTAVSQGFSGFQVPIIPCAKCLPIWHKG